MATALNNRATVRGRMLHATQVKGHQPFEAPDARGRPPHPRAALRRPS